MRTQIGPFGIMDMVGLQTAYKITDFWANRQSDQQARANADFVKQYIDQGKLGIQTGEGFYAYPDPIYKRPDFISGKK